MYLHIQMKYVYIYKMVSLFSNNFVVARSSAYFGQGNGPIWLDDVTCTGNENSLLNCNIKPWGVQNCMHNEDAGVDCNAGNVPPHHVMSYLSY